MKNILIIILFYTNCWAESQLLSLDNSRLSFDITSRTSYSERDKEYTLQHFIGLDFHTFLNDGQKDFGELTLQPYFHRIDNGQRTPGYYNDPHDWEFIFRTFTFTFTGLGNNYPWIKAGHFEIPFGVEATKNTFGNLHQYQQGPKLGQKMDWGIALGQELEQFQYEMAITRGSGLKYRNRENPYAFTGRISTLNDGYWAAGLSLYYGEILKEKETISRELAAIDFQYFYKSWGILSEFYFGKSNKNKTFGSLLEINWRNQDDSFEIYSQYFYRDSENTPEFASLVNGVKYHPSKNTILSLQLTSELSQAKDNQRNNIIEFQIRYYF